MPVMIGAPTLSSKKNALVLRAFNPVEGNYKYVAMKVRPKDLPSIALELVEHMASSLWWGITGGMTNQPEYKEMVERIKEADYDFSPFRAWTDAWEKEERAFVEAAVALVEKEHGESN